MLKSDEIRKKITAKVEETEKYRNEGKIAEAKAAAKEILKLKDELDVQLTLEKTADEEFFASAVPAGKKTFGVDMRNKCGGVPGDDYRKNFVNAIRGKFKNNAANYLRESSLPDGGYLVPSEFHKEIISQLDEENVMRQIGQTISTESVHQIPIVQTKPAAAWVGEGEEINFSNETFGSVNLSAYKLAVAIKVSNELLADSFYPIEQHLVHEFALAFGRAEEDAFLNGTTALGDTAKKPTGILPTLATSPSTTISTEGAEVTVNDLLNLEFSLKRPYRKRAVWLMSDSLLAIVRKMKDQVGRFIWEPSMTEAEPAKLYGYPVYTSPFMPSLASGNVIALFGDFADYFLIGERGQRVFKPLRELYAMADTTAYLMLERVDAKLTNLEAIKALKLK